MTWSEPKLLWLLALAPFFVGLLFWNGVRIGRRVTRLLGRGEGADLKPYKYPWIKFGLLTIAFSLLCIAAAGPRWDWHWIESKQRGLDIMVAIDVSRSMDVKDIDPSRIEHARRMVRDLLDIAEGDRIGLIAFAGVSFVQCPLTTDREAVRMFLDVINTNLIPTQGTDLAGAMSVAIKSLAASGEGTGKILMILSDGEDHKSDSQTAIAASINALKTAGIRVFSVGLGTPDGGPIPSDSGSFKSDRSGNMVISRLEVQVLKVISAGTDGIYVTGGTPGAQIEELYRSGMHRLGTELETRSQRERVWFERYQWFAGASLLLLIIEGLLKERILVGLFLLGIMLVEPPAVFAKDFRSAYNEGVAKAGQGDKKAAEDLFQEVSEHAADNVLRQRALSNLGVLKVESGDLEGAKKSFESALAMDPQDQQTRENLQWTQKQLKNKQESKKDDQKKDDQKKDDQKKDDQKKDDQKKDDQKKDDQKKDDQKKDDQKKDDQKKDDSSDKAKDGGDKNSDDKQQSSDKQDDKKDDKKNKEGKGSEEQEPKSENPGKEGGAADEKPREESKDLSKQEAEKLLRMIPDDFGKFYRPPATMQKPKDQAQDW